MTKFWKQRGWRERHWASTAVARQLLDEDGNDITKKEIETLKAQRGSRFVTLVSIGGGRM